MNDRYLCLQCSSEHFMLSIVTQVLQILEVGAAVGAPNFAHPDLGAGF